MPKPVLFLFAFVALAFAACNNSTPPSPTPAPSASYTPNPSITAGTVEVTYQASPVPKVPVSISTPLANNTASPRPGTAFYTAKTNSKGEVTFTKLKPGAYYCWVAEIPVQPTTPPTSPPIAASTCSNLWQYDVIQLGT